MAFMRRGDKTSMTDLNINTDSSQTNNARDIEIDKGYRIHHIYIHHRQYVHHYTNDYVAITIATTLIILITAAITYIVTYKSTIIDPIESVKKLFLNMHFIITAVLLGTTVIINLTSKSEEILFKRLMIIFVISIITMMVFLGIKLDLDTTYTREQFEQLYAEQNIGEEYSSKSKMDIGITGMGIKSEKEYYIDECMELYNIFKVKTYVTLGLHLLLNILLLFQIVRIKKIHNKKMRINKDDLILFDEEQNIRY